MRVGVTLSMARRAGPPNPVSRMLSLLARLGDRAFSAFPGALMGNGAHWMPGASATPTSGNVDLGPELVGNPGPFVNTAGWAVYTSCVIDTSGGNLRVTNNNTNGAAQYAVPTVTGLTYRYTVQNTGGAPFQCYDMTSGALLFTVNPGQTGEVISVATSTTGGVRIFVIGAAGTVGLIGSVSIKLATTMPTAVWLMDYVESTMSSAAAVDGPIGAVTDGQGVISPERFVNPVIATNTWTDQGGGQYYCKANVWGNLGMSVASASVPSLIGPNQFVRVRVTITGTFTALNLWSAVDSSGSNNAAVYAFPSAGIYDFVVKTSSYGGLWFDSATGMGATLSAISFKVVSGRHATQSAGANKPTSRRGVVALSKASDLSSGWTFGSLTPTTGQVGPSGANDATLLTVTLTNGHALYKTSESLIAGQRYTFAAEVKLGTATSVKVSVDDITSGVGQLANTEVAGQVSGGAWGIVAVPFTALNTTSNAMPLFFRDCASSGQTVFVRRVAILQGEVTAAQIKACGGIPLTASVPASSLQGNYALQMDGAATRLSLPGPVIDPNADHFILVGARVGATAGPWQSVFGQAAQGTGESLPALGFTNVGTPVVYYAGGGTSVSLGAGTAYLNQPTIIDASCVSRSLVLSVNGVQANTNVLSGAYTAPTAAMIGALPRSTPADFVNGLIYGVIAVRGSLTEAERQTLRRGMAALTGPIPNALQIP